MCHTHTHKHTHIHTHTHTHTHTHIYIYIYIYPSFFPVHFDQSSSRVLPFRGFAIALRHMTLGTTPVDECSAWRRDLYLATNNTKKKQISMPPAGFGPTISVSERPQTYSFDGAATGIGIYIFIMLCHCEVCEWRYTIKLPEQREGRDCRDVLMNIPLHLTTKIFNFFLVWEHLSGSRFHGPV